MPTHIPLAQCCLRARNKCRKRQTCKPLRHAKRNPYEMEIGIVYITLRNVAKDNSRFSSLHCSLYLGKGRVNVTQIKNHSHVHIVQRCCFYSQFLNRILKTSCFMWWTLLQWALTSRQQQRHSSQLLHSITTLRFPADEAPGEWARGGTEAVTSHSRD